jgi:hypothetical protein
MKAIRLWTGILGGPLIWLVYLEVAYALTPSACIAGHKQVLGAATAVTLLATLAPTLVAWSAWRAAGATTVTEPAHPLARNRFMALSGLGLSGLSALLVAASAIPIIVLGACD